MSVFFDRLLNTYSKVSDALTFNAATLSGAIDIIVVHHSDDTFTSTPFHVRFGKLQLLKSREKLVTIQVNGQECQWKMKLGVAGEAFFVMDAERQQPATEEELSSPITSPVLSPAAVLTTTQGTITAVNPQPHGGSKADSGRPKHSSHSHEEFKFPDLDLSQSTLSPPPAYTPKQAGRGRVLNVVDSPSHGRSASETTVSQSRFHSTPSKRLKEEEDERTVAEAVTGGSGAGELDGEIEDDMRWALQHESKDEISNAVRLTRQCVSAPLSPLSPRSPRSPRSPHSSVSALTLTPTSQVYSDASASDGALPPSHPLRVAASMASMEQTLSPGPASPRSPSSPSFGGDDDRTLSAPSADGALDHVFTWTWGHLPVHHQRYHPQEQSRAEQIIHSPPPVGTSPATLPMTPPRSTHVPQSSPAASATAAVSAASIDLKGDVVNELKQEAAAAAASLDQPHLTAAAVDSRSWSVRGIFASVFSKLPARSSFSLPYAGTVDTPPGAPVSEVKEDTALPQPSTDSSAPSSSTSFSPTEPSPALAAKSVHVPNGSINLAEAHLPVPWLNKGIDADDRDSSPSAQHKPSEPPSQAPRDNGAASPPPSYDASLSAVSSSTAASDVLTSPLSAPLPSTFSPAFSLPSQARPASAMEGSLLNRPDDPQRSPSSQSSASTPSSPSLQPLDASLLRLSLCGHYLGSNAELNRSLFDRHSISYDQLAAQPELTFRSDLVVLYQQRLYPSRIALPLILSHLAFGRSLAISVEGLERLSTMPLPHPALVDAADAARQDSAADEAKGTGKGASDEAAAGAEAGGRSSWRDWFRYRQPESTPRYKKPPPIDTVNERGTSAAIQSATQARLSDSQEMEAARAALTHSRSLEAMPSAPAPDDAGDAPLTTITVSGPGSPPFPSTSSVNPSGPSPTQGRPKTPSPSPPSFIKSLRPTSTMLKSLGLKAGRNSVTFTVSSALQGQQTVSASIYLWSPDVKIVISDIDGTITKSDILGHVMPLVGRDWSHVGVTQLYSDIHRNGYQLLYLTSRAIGQANITRGYIQGLRQGESSLPYGPVIMSPDRLLHSFRREVIHRRPQEFKIVALRDVKGLFDDDYNPFVAGFGNRITDVVAYRAVGVPSPRIFIIDHHGRIQHTNVAYSKSYPELGGLVNAMFPAILDGRKGVEEFNNFNFWKAPIASLSEDEEDDDEDDSEEEEEGVQTPQENSGAETVKISGSSIAVEAEKREVQKEAEVITAPGRSKVIGTI